MAELFGRSVSKSGKALGRAQSHLLALEPRMMFDGAAVATIVDTGNQINSSDGSWASLSEFLPEVQSLPAVAFDADAGFSWLPGQQEAAAAAPQVDEAAGSSAAPNDYIFIDTSVTGYQLLASEWAGRGTIVYIDSATDGLAQMQSALSGASNVGAIHIVSHGVEGAFFLGSTRIDQASVNGALAGAFAEIGSHLAADGDILIYGCDVGAGEAGQGLLDALAEKSGADVAASIDDTGFALRGGNWALENRLGMIDGAILTAYDWQGLMVPALISVSSATSNLIVYNAAGVQVSSTVGTDTGFTGGVSVGVTAGGYAVWQNAGTIGGQAIDLRAVVVSSTTSGTTPDTIKFNQLTTTTNDPGFLVQSSGTAGTASIQVRWEMVLAGTNTLIAGDVNFTIADIDGTGANSAAGLLLNAPTREFVVVNTDTLSSFQSAATTDIKFNTATAGSVTAFGTVNETASPAQPISAARFNWLNTSQWVITYNIIRSGATQAGFNHDGNNEFNFGTGGVTTSIPRIDLDANDSSSTGSGYRATFTENGAAVSIVDADPIITNPVGTIQSTTITLTNAQVGDQFLVNGSTTASGTLTSGIAYAITATGVNFTGAFSQAQYEAALRTVTFRNTTERPATVDRSITIGFTNGTFASNNAVSTIQVIEVNDMPTAVNDGPLTTAEDTPILNINVLANDTDGEAVAPTTGDLLTVTTATALNGSVTINANGTLNYTPNLNFNGTDTISYTISDGRGGTSSATVPITITAVNDTPTRVGTLPSRANLDATAGINVATAAAFADVDNATLTYSAVGLPTGLTINSATGIVTGTINRSASQNAPGGVYNVVVTASDGSLSTTQVFTWTVTNPGPIATDDATLITDEDMLGTTVNVLANDSDPDGDPLTITSATAANGSVVINANGTFSYQPNLDFNGTDTITYSISDSQGGTATATIPVTINAVNDAPKPVGTLPSRTNIDAAAGISVATAAAFADVDNATLSYSAASLPAGLTINSATGVITGTIDRAASQGGVGGVHSVVVTASDGSLSTSQTFSWTVTNPAPTAVNDSATTNEDTPIPSINVRGNDSDPDGDPLNITAASAPNGTVTINGDGTLRYAPNANFNGTDTITYTISDGNGGTSTATVTVTVIAVNDAPTPVGTLPPQTNVDAATGISIPTSSAFADVDNAALTYSVSGLPAGLTINATTGVISGAVDRSASQGGTGGVYSVVVTARDAGGLTTTQPFSWTITNPPPVAVDDEETLNEDASILIPVLPNDGDPDGDPLTLVSTVAALGTATVFGNQVRYTPPANFSGTTTISYTISDGQGGTSTATINVTVNPLNDAPTATAIPPRNTLDGATVSVPVASYFTDVDGDALSYSQTGLPLGLSINETTGVISGTIDKNASQINGGSYTVVITVSDGKGGNVVQNMAFVVANPRPFASNDSATTNEDAPVTISVLDNDADPDGDSLTLFGTSALHGTVAVNANGTLTYTPNTGYSGPDTITYNISDGQGGTATATVAITVIELNDPPTGSGVISNQTNLDRQTIALPVAGAFFDPDADSLTYTATGLPEGLAINLNTGVISGTIDKAASQVNGGVYNIVVTANDGNATVTQTFTWTVSNPTPTASNDIVTTNEDTFVDINVVGNDSDPDGDPLSVTSATAGNGTVTFSGGTIRYTPNSNFHGTDTIIYEMTDSDGGFSTATVTITVDPINDAPTTVGLPPQNGEDGGTVSFSVASAFNDVDGDMLTYTATGLPNSLTIDPATGLVSGTLDPGTSAGGPYTVTIRAIDPSGEFVETTFLYSVQNVPPIAVNDFATTDEDVPVVIAVLAGAGSVPDSDPDGDPLTITAASATNGTVQIIGKTVKFTPDPHFNGVAIVTYTISDGNGGFATATATITVGAVNDAPTSLALPDLANIDNQSVSVNVGSFFSDLDGDTLRFSALDLPPGLGIDPVTGIISGAIDKAASLAPNGEYSVTITARDPLGLETSQTFIWTVTNPAPTAINDTAMTVEDTPVDISVLLNDTDPDQDPLVITSASALNGTVTIVGGVLTYTPNEHYFGNDTIIYVISDQNGGTSTAAVAVTVASVNDDPEALNDVARTNEDTPIDIPVLVNDSDVDLDTLTITAASSLDGTAVFNPDGTITFTPRENFTGIATINYSISDGKGGTASAIVRVAVDAVNDAPVANPSFATTDEEISVDIPVLANDTDVDGDTLTVTAATASNGTVVINADGTVTYTPKLNFNGTDTITYTVSDGNGGFSTSTVTVTVNAVNDVPVATAIPPQSHNDADIVSVPVAGNFFDVDGDTLSFTATGLPDGLSISAAGVISGIINKAASQLNGGVYSVTVTASDGKGGTVDQIFTWTVVNPAPTANEDLATTAEDVDVTVTVLSNDVDPDGDTLTVTTASALHGTVSIDPLTNQILYSPNDNFNGADTITYTISDGNGGTSTATVSVTVTPVNDMPTSIAVIADQVNLDVDMISVPTAATFSDLDGDILRYSATGLPLGLSINAATGIISGAIDKNASQPAGGIYSITVTASDGSLTAENSFTWTITNPVPTANNDGVTTDEDVASAPIAVLLNDVDPDGDPLTISSAAATNGTVTINPDGTLRYTPNLNFNGTDTITYEISDGNGGTSSATVAVRITAVNDAPTIVSPIADRTSVDGAVITIPVAARFFDLDGDTLSFTATGLPLGLDISSAGVISGTINKNASQVSGGVYIVSVTADDGKGGTVVSIFTITVTNPAPTANNDVASTDEDIASAPIDVLGNDSDPDNDGLTVASATAPNGTVTINLDGTLVYTPNDNFNGIDTITYAISDRQGGTSTATVEVTVNAVNDTPIVDTPIANQTNLDADIVSVPTAASFSDIDSATLSYSATGLPLGLTINTITGVISGTIDKNASQPAGGVYSVTITASDGSKSASSSFDWTVTNPTPTAANDIAATDEDSDVTVAVLANDVDPDRDLLTVIAASALHGTVVRNLDGTLTYTPDENYNGDDTITYSISDGNGGTSTATVAVTVVAVNDDPTGTALPPLNSTDSTDLTGGAGIDVSGNFTDLDGDVLSFTATGLPPGLNIDAAGIISGTIDRAASQGGVGGVYTVTVTADDSAGGTVSQTFTWTVTNPAPTVVAPLGGQTHTDAATVLVPTAAAFTDIDGDTLSYSVTGLPLGLSIDTITGVISGTIDKAASQPNGGIYSVAVTASDGNGGTVSSSFTWTVTNPAPTATNDMATTDEDTLVNIALRVNDSDPDGDALTITTASAPNGTVVIKPDGTLDYTPNLNFNGTDTITYTISDGNGGTSTATVLVTVTSVNDTPVSTAIAAQSNVDSTPVSVPVAGNFSDVEATPLSFTATGLPAGLSIHPTTGVISGTIDKAASQITGGVYSVTVTATDPGLASTSQTFTWTVTNPAPMASNDTASTAEDTASAPIVVLFNDTDPDGDTLVVTSATATSGTVVINSNGTLVFRPNLNFNGSDMITYTISDSNGGTSTATVAVTVTAANDAPVGTAIAPQVSVDSSVVSLPVAANFSDVDNTPLVFSATGLPEGLSINPTTGVISGTISKGASQPNGGIYSVTVTASDGSLSTSQIYSWTVTNPVPIATNDVAATAEDMPSAPISVLTNDVDPDGDTLKVISATAPNGVVVINSDGSLSYTPNRNFNGSDTITYTISDSNGGTSTATVAVTVTPVNDPPVVATPIANQTNLDADVVSLATATNFSDLDSATLSYSASGLPLGLTINAMTGVISGTIDKNASQPAGGVYTISVSASDGDLSASSSFTWTVTNPAPTATNDAASTNEDALVNIDVRANDRDPDVDPLIIVTASAPNGTVTIKPDGTLDYTPNLNFNGIDTITYTVSDSNGGTSTATVAVTVNPINDTPVSVNDSAATSEDEPVTINILGNDRDVDGDLLTVTAASSPNGVVVINADGTITFTPAPHFNGPTTITYTVSDGKGGTTTATVTVNVSSVNDLPVAQNDIAATNEDSPVTISVLANDSDVDGDTLTITGATSPNGAVAINADGTITFTPAANFNGPATVTYMISDGKGGTSTATVAINVVAINDIPVAIADSATTTEDTPVTINLLGNDGDLDSDTLTVTAATSPNGAVVINADGTIIFTPAPNFHGPTTITYTVSDGKGGTSTATVTLNVTPINDQPVAMNDVAATDADTPVRIAVLVNDSDVDGDPLTITRASSPNGTVTINADGTINFAPTSGFVGATSITYTVSDGKGGTSTATVAVTVRQTNAPPVDGNEAISTIGGVENVISVLANARDTDGNPVTLFSAQADVGTVVINADGTVTYVAPFGFQGIATITYVVSDGKGGFDQSTVTISVQQASADINAMIGDWSGPANADQGSFQPLPLSQLGFISAPPYVLGAVNEFRSLNGTPDLTDRRPLLTAINGISSLRGIGELDGDHSPIGEVVDQIDQIRDIRFGADRLFDRRFGDFILKSLTGFSVRQLNTGQDQVMIESVVRDRVVYMEVRDIGKDRDPHMVEYQLRMRDGGPLPDWIRMDKRGLALIERPVDAETLHLIVRAVRADGKTLDIPILIQGATGEIQIDEKLDGKRISAAEPLSKTMATVNAAAATETARLAAAFSGQA